MRQAQGLRRPRDSDNRPRQPARPLLPPRDRRPAAIIGICCALVTLIIGLLTLHATQADPLDRAIDSWIRLHIGVHHHAMQSLEQLGEVPEIAFVTCLIVAACLAVRRVNGALLAVISIVVSIALTEVVLKPLFDRTLDGFAVYPSGHTGRVFTLTAVVVVLLLNPRAAKIAPALKAGVAILGVLLGCVVAVAMIGLNAHYFTDTVGGAALAVAVVIATAFLLDTESLRSRLAFANPKADGNAPGPQITPGGRSAAPLQEADKKD